MFLIFGKNMDKVELDAVERLDILDSELHKILETWENIPEEIVDWKEKFPEEYQTNHKIISLIQDTRNLFYSLKKTYIRTMLNCISLIVQAKKQIKKKSGKDLSLELKKIRQQLEKQAVIQPGSLNHHSRTIRALDANYTRILAFLDQFEKRHPSEKNILNFYIFIVNKAHEETGGKLALMKSIEDIKRSYYLAIKNIM